MFQLIVNAAIDHVETKVNAQRTAAQSTGGGGKLESYLGFLYPINGMRVCVRPTRAAPACATHAARSSSQLRLRDEYEAEVHRRAGRRGREGVRHALGAPARARRPSRPARHRCHARAQFFRRLHALYSDTVANPFHTPDTELHACATFQRQIGRIVEAGLFTGVRVGAGGV
jgi:hypothetical protein